MAVRAVTFDVGNTLLYSSPGEEQIFVEEARLRGFDVRLEDTLACRPLMNDFYERQYLKDGDFWCDHDRATQLWLDMYKLMACHVGLGEYAQELAEAVHGHYLHAGCWEIYDDVIGCLQGLKRRGLALGVVSNWDKSLTGLLRELGLLPYFDCVIASAAYGYRKPNSLIFQTACAELGVQAEELVHVGDLPEADGAAEAMGAKAVIIDRKERIGALCPYAVISDLRDLLPLLDGSV